MKIIRRFFYHKCRICPMNWLHNIQAYYGVCIVGHTRHLVALVFCLAPNCTWKFLKDLVIGWWGIKIWRSVSVSWLGGKICVKLTDTDIVFTKFSIYSNSEQCYQENGQQFQIHFDNFFGFCFMKQSIRQIGVSYCDLHRVPGSVYIYATDTVDGFEL